MLKRTPFYSIHQQLGAKLVDFAGYEMPVQYKGIKAEHNAVREQVGVFDVSHMGEFIVKGKEALALIQKTCVNDASKLVPGKAQYTCMCNDKGGIIDDLIIYMLDDNEYLLVVNSANIEKDFNWLKAHNTFEAELINKSDDYALLAVQGPHSLDTLQLLTETNLREIRPYSFEMAKLAGVEMIISATGYTGEMGFELYFETDGVDVEKIWNAIFSAGADYGIEACGLGARDTLRLEMGFALYGNDISEETHPLEARLGWITKLDKEDFIGKEVLLKKKNEGNKKQLVGFVLQDNRTLPRAGYDILGEDDKKIGEVTSGTISITLGKGIGMGYVEKNYSAEGTVVQIAVRNRKGEAIITRPPFIKK